MSPPTVERICFQADEQVGIGCNLIGRGLQESCMICLQDFQVGESLGRLTCHHTFHIPCLEEWMKTRAGAQLWCPLRCSVDAGPHQERLKVVKQVASLAIAL
eukprot:5141918-Amphidinium_carterae.1